MEASRHQLGRLISAVAALVFSFAEPIRAFEIAEKSAPVLVPYLAYAVLTAWPITILPIQLLGALLLGAVGATIAALVGRAYHVSIPYTRYLSLLGYAFLPGALGIGITQALVRLFPEQPLTLSALDVLPALNVYSRIVIGLATSPFLLWSLGLVSVGFAHLQKAERGRGYVLSGVYLVWLMTYQIGLTAAQGWLLQWVKQLN